MKRLKMGTCEAVSGIFLIERPQVQILLGTPPLTSFLTPKFRLLFNFFSYKFALASRGVFCYFWHTFAQWAEIRGVAL